MRLIDADELIKQIEADAEHIETPLAKMFLYANISDIKHAPTIAQPEIIRCRECRHWYTGDGYNHENGAQCALTHMWMSPDDYCSYGRRKVSE